jgi:hypothetical protein
VISGNAVGVFVTGSNSAGNLIGANYVGTDATGGSGIGNLTDGVLFASGAARNSVGGAGGDSSNRIAFNRGNGISARGDAGAGNLFRNNAIFANGALGIDLGADGPTPNHSGPSSSGPNNFLNHPVLSSVSSSGGNTTISGSLDGVGAGTFTLEFFGNDARDRSGFGQGQVPIESF